MKLHFKVGVLLILLLLQDVFVSSAFGYKHYDSKDSIELLQFLGQLQKIIYSELSLSKNDSIKVVNEIERARSLNYTMGEIMCFNLLGVSERNKSSYLESLRFHKLALDLLGEKSNVKYKAILLNNIGVVYRRMDNFASAIQYHLHALEIAEKYNDNPTICISLNSLGNIFMEQKKYDLALKNFLQALEREKMAKNLLGVAINYNNIGDVYLARKEYPIALDYLCKSLDCNSKMNNKKGMAICYNDIGELYFEQKHYKSALLCFKNALNLILSTEDLIYTADSYINIGKTERMTGELDEALSALFSGLKIANNIGSGSHISSAYQELSSLYELKGNIPKALFYYKNYIHCKDSIATVESENYLNRMQVLYESGQKDKEIDLLKYKEIVTMKKHKIVVSSLIIGCFFLLLLVGMIYYNYRLKQRGNENLLSYSRDIEEKNRLLTKQKEEIILQKDDIEQKGKQINQAYELIMVKNNSTMENIRYALQIQNSLLPGKAYIDSLVKDNFLFYKPKDIVSGDFYWVTEKNGLVVLVAGDCTGHGVTGAFMSILGITALNEIVVENGVVSTSKILNKMREKIIWTLQQGGAFIEMRDGIQMVVCTIDKVNRKLQFSGALNSIILARAGELTVYKGDKMPVSIYPNMTDFKEIDIYLNKNDMIYLYTDGYYGQFGGNYDRKFNMDQFRTLLIESSRLSMNEQLHKLEETFQMWIGNSEQVDDILVMGIRVN